MGVNYFNPLVYPQSSISYFSDLTDNDYITLGVNINLLQDITHVSKIK